MKYIHTIGFCQFTTNYDGEKLAFLNDSPVYNEQMATNTAGGGKAVVASADSLSIPLTVPEKGGP